MNDITYRPFIRDSALGDINIQIPNLEIPVYKPRYSQPLEDDTETEVQSQVEEIRNPEPIHIAPSGRTTVSKKWAPASMPIPAK